MKETKILMPTAEMDLVIAVLMKDNGKISRGKQKNTQQKMCYDSVVHNLPNAWQYSKSIPTNVLNCHSTYCHGTCNVYPSDVIQSITALNPCKYTTYCFTSVSKKNNVKILRRLRKQTRSFKLDHC
jgi:hypothetical protein